MRGERRLDIQGLRALAILFVVAYHGHLGLGSGFIGVDAFFAISGYVITAVLVRELARADSLSLPGFYARRVKRILPALAVMVTLVATAGIYLAPVGALHITSLTALAASVFGANWYAAHLPDGYFAISSAADPLLHTWSLGVEEQFYLVYPVLLLGGWLLGKRFGAARATAAGVVGVVAACSFALAWEWAGSDAARAFYASPTRAWEFGVGALTALLAPALSRLPVVAAWMLATAALPVLLASSFVSGEEPLRLAVPVLATCALMAAGSRPNGISRLLAFPALVALGDLSYSLYLWHWPLIVFGRALFPTSTVAAPVAAFLSIVPALVSYRWVEQPIRAGGLSGRPVVLLAAACIAVPAGAAMSITSASLATRNLYLDTAHADVNRGCDAATPLGAPGRPQCTFAVKRSVGTVVLIGDSNAGQFTEPVVRAANRLGFDVDVATFSACPFVLLHVSSKHRDGADCEAHNTESLAALKRMRPNLVVTASRTDTWINDDYNSLGTPLTASTPVKARLYEGSLRRVVRTLSGEGIPVVVVHPVPLLPVDASGCASVLIVMGGCSGSVARTVVDGELARTMHVERQALRGSRGAWLLNLENDICGRTTCSVRRDGTLMYRNENHLNVAGALMLTDRFASVIAARARRES